MVDETYFLKKSRELSMNVNSWKRIQPSAGEFRDNFVGIDFYSDPSDNWNIVEAVASKAMSDGTGVTPTTMLSLLVRIGSDRGGEVDRGFGKFRRSTRPGTFSIGDEDKTRSIQGEGPFHAVTTFFPTQLLREKLTLMLGKEAPALDFLYTREHQDSRIEGLMWSLLNSHRRSQGDLGLMERDQIKDEILKRLAALAEVKVFQPGSEDKLLPQNINRVLEYMHANFGRQMTRDELAGVSGVVPDHFTRLFRQTVGETPMQYILNLRMNRAVELLRTSDAETPVSVIAEKCGFEVLAHFSRKFRGYTGMSPTAFRESVG